MDYNIYYNNIMNKIIKMYLVFFMISILFIICKIKYIYKVDKLWFLKTILMYFTCIIMIFSLFYNIKIINYYILPLLLFINILLLIPISFFNKYNLINLIPLIGIIYILVIFNIKDFIINKGILINPNKKWIYIHIIVLLLFYLMANNSILNKSSKIGLSILLFYPLLFPINEYFLHRIFSLCILCPFPWLFIN